MSGLESIFSKDIAKVVSYDRKKSLHEEYAKRDLPMQNLLSNEERNKAKRAKRFR